MKVKSNTCYYKLGKSIIFLVIPEGLIPPPEIKLYNAPKEYVYTYWK